MAYPSIVFGGRRSLARTRAMYSPTVSDSLRAGSRRRLGPVLDQKFVPAQSDQVLIHPPGEMSGLLPISGMERKRHPFTGRLQFYGEIVGGDSIPPSADTDRFENSGSPVAKICFWERSFVHWGVVLPLYCRFYCPKMCVYVRILFFAVLSEIKCFPRRKRSTPRWNRTNNPVIKSHLLCQLS